MAQLSIAIILVDATEPLKLSQSTVQDAMESASPFCILFTKTDIIVPDYSTLHLSYLNRMRTLAWQYDVDCISASFITKEGMDDLIAYIGARI